MNASCFADWKSQTLIYFNTDTRYAHFRGISRDKIYQHLFEPFCVWILEVTSLPVRCSMDTDVPFSRWDGDRVTAWMNEIGLNMYLGECKRWVRNGEQLLKASVHDLEKVRCL